MVIEGRRERERSARRELIITTARSIAEAEGWEAVTTRRLSSEIEYSQPVIYKHFAGMEDIAEAVAVEGFTELATVIRNARAGTETAEQALTRTAEAYLDFARTSPAVYDAMFSRPTTLHFAAADTPPQLMAAFGELREVVEPLGEDEDFDTLTEVVFAALHGLATLRRGGRLRPDHDTDRIRMLVRQITT
ncbi:TetR/AcrR family transcriptional regulator [Gordonia sp. GONU]|uniref:TetR/AcrR family transcriptional regulator n=1 Tax=Gordonia sp. GONU TaxID=2972949 RepID=UPI0021AC7757|nr:TetR/AcrR family transcriptional regulator [Gordonia sp. GONU]MCR8897090.1 TetR/AcrR family transcriptional regulator [Gordonia sp. GONU]